MQVYCEVLPARKSSRHSAINWTPSEDNATSHVAGRLRIDTDRASVTYVVSEFPVSWPGRGFHFHKVTAGTDATQESYSVFCSTAGPAHDSCDCAGFTYSRGKPCKHVDSVRALVANNWL